MQVCEYMQRIEFIVNDYTRMWGVLTRAIEDRVASCMFGSQEDQRQHLAFTFISFYSFLF